MRLADILQLFTNFQKCIGYPSRKTSTAILRTFLPSLWMKDGCEWLPDSQGEKEFTVKGSYLEHHKVRTLFYLPIYGHRRCLWALLKSCWLLPSQSYSMEQLYEGHLLKLSCQPSCFFRWPWGNCPNR